MSEFMPKSPFNEEFDTQPRHSLAYSLIGSVDRFVAHPSSVIRDGTATTNAPRIISYEISNKDQLDLREALIEQKLILGHLLTDEDEQEQAFRVPRSARPLSYEVRATDEGMYSYNDEQLFYDLGEISFALYEIGGQRNVLAGRIGRLVALTEFVRPGERPIKFVPGVEKATAKLSEAIDPVAYYDEKLEEEFGDRYDGQGVFFRMGFHNASTEQME